MEDALQRIKLALSTTYQGPLWKRGGSDGVGATAAFHRLADGTVDGAPRFDGFTLLSASEAQQEKTMMDTLARDEAWEPSWWSPSWWPFGADHAGQLLVVDADSGAVIEFVHDDEVRSVLASSLTAWFQSVATRLESGALVHDAKLGIIEPSLRAAIDENAAKRKARTDDGARASRRTNLTLAVILAVVVVAVAMAAWFESRRPTEPVAVPEGGLGIATP